MIGRVSTVFRQNSASVDVGIDVTKIKVEKKEADESDLNIDNYNRHQVFVKSQRTKSNLYVGVFVFETHLNG